MPRSIISPSRKRPLVKWISATAFINSTASITDVKSLDCFKAYYFSTAYAKYPNRNFAQRQVVTITSLQGKVMGKVVRIIQRDLSVD